MPTPSLFDNDHFDIPNTSRYTRSHVLRVVMQVKVQSIAVEVEVGDADLLEQGW